MVKPDKSRYVYLFLPSKEAKLRWEKPAEEAGIQLSKFVIEIVESSLNDDTEFKPRSELVKEIGINWKENKELRYEIKLKNVVFDRYDSELKRYRSAAFLDDGFEGARKYNTELIDILKHRGTIDSYKILEILGIGPGDSDLVKAVSR